MFGEGFKTNRFGMTQMMVVESGEAKDEAKEVESDEEKGEEQGSGGR